jgi:CRISPR type III-A-associated protein Csm2
MTQMRQVYNQIRRAQAHFKDDNAGNGLEEAQTTLVLLKSKLAYQASRSDSMEVVHEELAGMIEALAVGDSDAANDYEQLAQRANDESERLTVFFELTEAIMGYFRYESEVKEN